MQEVSLFGEKTYQWAIGDSIFQAWPERGARLMSWAQPKRTIIHWPEINSAEAVPKVRGGNPVLFPFSARTFHNGEIGKWQDTKGQVRTMPNHGITRQGKFKLSDINASGFTARLISGDAEQEIYPYSYEFDVCYRFEESGLEVDYLLKNLDDEAIPWSAGHHFYFQLPWVSNTTREDYQIDIPAECAVYHNPAGELLATDFEKTVAFNQPKLVDRIHYKLEQSKFTCRCLKDDSTLAVIFKNLHPDNALVTWTENEQSPFYCIEPWMGPPSAVSTNIGLHWVQPGEIGKFSVRVEI